jgi:dTDP-4-dehydrorhamnose 3,5-epimerase
MKFTETNLKGAYIIEPEPSTDERGFFARSWDVNEFKKIGLNSNIVQSSISYNKLKGTVRGMHYQIKPYEETKLVRCTSGSAFEVVLDLRPKSKTFLKWTSVELTSDNYKMIYAPEGCALGFQTLENNTELIYQMSQFYSPEFQRGIRWNDTYFNIEWPLKSTVISKRDTFFPDFKNLSHS